MSQPAIVSNRWGATIGTLKYSRLVREWGWVPAGERYRAPPPVTHPIQSSGSECEGTLSNAPFPPSIPIT